ncbi:hypothetical protein RB2654_15215 [Rhodobacterales bacterium HTCC2654]|uniref:Uncharacterized protein n=1 Tax=Maritimibacter alkaliphilus HTCC2654 TaxID=314271 RepID=A3VH92_9RHOB|nr:hypothetical protein RB2654_15215 [Rhodobacterales bacterium HTCC2654] [Maritimibacter alkaliphilus HTCC2654]
MFVMSWVMTSSARVIVNPLPSRPSMIELLLASRVHSSGSGMSTSSRISFGRLTASPQR